MITRLAFVISVFAGLIAFAAQYASPAAIAQAEAFAHSLGL